MTSQTPPTIQTTLPHDSPPRVKNVHSDLSYQSDVLEKARMAVLLDLGSYIPMITFQNFLDFLAPPQPEFDLESTMRSLKSGTVPVLTSSNGWSKFPKVQKKKEIPDKEDPVFSQMPELFTKVVADIVANSRGKLSEENRTIDFLQNPNRAPISTERRNESRPDGYFVLKHRDKVMSKKGEEDIRWADIALSCEYKLKDSNT